MSSQARAEYDEKDEDLLEMFKGWFKQIAEVEAGQRKRENEDLRFQVNEYQWDEKSRIARLGLDGRPPRPVVSVSLTKQPMQLVKNQAAAADLGVDFRPVSEEADKDVAADFQGLYLHITSDTNAQVSRMWAFDRAVQCGRGYYYITSQFDEDGDDEFDQELAFRRILDGACVGLDPAAQEPDKSDASWGYIDEYMAFADFKNEFPNTELATLTDDDFADLASNEPGWVTGSEGKRAVRVPQVWRKKKTRTKVCLVKARAGEQADKRGLAVVPESEVGRRKVYTRKTREDVTLCWYRITARDIIDREEYEGLRLIPIIPVVWSELQPFDGEQRYEGMQRPAMDAQKGFNAAISGAVEDVGRLSKVPYIGPSGTFEGHQEKWDSINTHNWPYVEYNIVKSPDGSLATPPAPMQIDGTKLGLSLQLAEMFKGLVQSATSVYDPSLGKPSGGHVAAKKVIAEQQQSDAATSGGLENLTRITLNYEARVIKERIPYYYDRPGRVVHILGKEDKERMVMLNAPHVIGQDGRPQRVVGRNTQGARIVDFRKGKYSVAATVGKSYQTQMQEGQAIWSELLPNLPPEAQVILMPTAMKFMNTPGAKDASDLMAKFRDAKFPGLVGDDKNQPTPDQLKAQLAGQGQAMQEMQQKLQMAMQEIQTQQAKQQAEIYKAQLGFQEALALQDKKNAGALAVAETNARAKGVQSANEAEVTLAATGIKAAAEAERATVDRDHERRMQMADHAHDVGMAAGGGRTMTGTSERGHDGEQEHSQEQSRGGSDERSQAPQDNGGTE